MRLRTWVLLALFFCSTTSFAQEPPKPEQLKRMYDDAVEQLKAAQDRKNELAQQNEQLTAKIAELTKELEAVRAETLNLKRRDAESAERSFFLRSQYAAFQQFLSRYPEMKARWDAYLENSMLSPQSDGPLFLDRSWPTASGGEG